ncbi:MAG TPA: glycoside hydrolase family 52 protein [Capsulimonadaceae bacterium]|jgi:hypothetical protein
MNDNISSLFFNAQHSPIGAFSSFTIGYPGAKGGLGLELGAPANQNVYIGIQSRDGEYYEAMPFCDVAPGDDEAKRYDVEHSDRGIVEETVASHKPIRIFGSGAISRTFAVSTDSWRGGDLEFTVYSPVMPVPDPATASDDELRFALAPVVLTELTVDNSQGTEARRAFFGYTGSDPYAAMRRLEDTSEGRFIGVGQGRMTAIAARGDSVNAALGFSIDTILSNDHSDNFAFSLGNCGLLLMDTPAGQRCTFQIAISFYRGGLATSGLDTNYLYTRWFANIEDVCEYGLSHFAEYKAAAELADRDFSPDGLSTDQCFMIAHSIRSYYGSTQLLEHDGEPLWVVNEGEYRMMNTFDLTVDQLFFEIRMNPWTVRNELDFFLERYSYHDYLQFPGDGEVHPGGVTFAHDMGVGNVFSRPRFSSYELSGLRGCFSYMSQEQLVNWILVAGVYIEVACDENWRNANLETLKACFLSMLNRDHPDPEKRDGVMSLDSSRTGGGAEITTYDSLDESLGQARNNIYLAMKCWAGYVILQRLFDSTGNGNLAAHANDQAKRCANTLISHMTSDGFIPAVLEHGNASKIIPVIEGLAYPFFAGCAEAVKPQGPYSGLLSALSTHLTNVLVPGACLFADGAWKLSSTSNNSWLSKIYLCQFVARHILGISGDQVTARADGAHVAWLTDNDNAYWAWSDQMLSGRAVGSRYYPRGVTSVLWMYELSVYEPK